VGEIQKFEESHIPEVAALEIKVFHQRSSATSSALEQYFAKMFFQNPWRETELSSYVYIQGGKLVGFIGVVPRPMEFNGRKILVGTSSQLMVDETLRSASGGRGVPPGVGYALTKRFFAGPQDFSYTDGATEAACAVWTAAGAKVARLYSLEWLRVLRPVRYYQGKLSRHPRAGFRTMARAMFAGCWLADMALSKLPFHALSPPASDLISVPAGAEELLQCLNEIGWQDALKPSYDSASLRWLLSEAASARHRGELRSVVVRDAGGKSAGWYVYYAKPGGVFVVLQIGAASRRMNTVLQALWRDAWEQGALAIHGQAIPRHLLGFETRHCSFRYPGNGVLVHSRDPQLLACVLQGEAALTRLDGEWWMRFADTDWSEGRHQGQ
jgi:hypothetical protein